MPIEKLPSHLINQIAAGEVVEGPLSVVKELVENSLDASATQIHIQIEDGGYGLIKVQDNGKGIPKDQLPKALERHATSKMHHKDLFHIETLGFRGEALASMASVAKLTLSSRTKDQDLAFSLSSGTHHNLEAFKAPIGTTVNVADLFANIPARLSFARSERSTRLALQQFLRTYALAYPDVGFAITYNQKPFGDKACQETPASTPPAHTHTPSDSSLLDPFLHSLNQRLQGLFPDIPPSDWHRIDVKENNYTLKGFIASPHHHFATKAHHYFFVKGRPLKDKVLSLSLSLAYQDVIPHARFPMAILFLDLPFKKIDMNVHPAKEEVRFAEPLFLKKWLIHSLKKQIHAPLIHRQALPLEKNEPSSPTAQAQASGDVLSPHFKLVPEKNLPPGAFPTVPPSLSNQLSPSSEEHDRHASSPQAYRVAETQSLGNAWLTKPSLPKQASAPPPHAQELSSQSDPEIKPATMAAHQPSFLPEKAQPLGRVIGQVHGSYIVAENAEGLVLVDQHAAHERINYEKLKAKLQDPQNSQSLTVPLFIPLDANLQGSLSKAHFALLKRYGIHLEPQGDKALALYSAPAFLKPAAWPQWIQDLFHETLDAERKTPLTPAIPFEEKAYATQPQPASPKKSSSGNASGTPSSSEDATLFLESLLLRKIERLLGNEACKNSLKANTPLNAQQMDHLLRQIEHTPRGGSCNHGRPSFVVLSRKELDRLFERK